MQNESFYIAPISLLGDSDFGLNYNTKQLFAKSVMHGIGVELRWIACKQRESISDYNIPGYGKNLHSKAVKTQLRSNTHTQGISRLGED